MRNNPKGKRRYRVAKISTLLAVIAITLLTTASSVTATVQINGAGATFPYPLIKKTEVGFNSTYPGYQVNYQPVGSGTGINDLITKATDFSGSDAPLTDAQRSSAPNSLHIPETIGSITLSYNLPSIGSGLNLTGPIAADIYRGVITNWNDATIQSINPSVSLPNHAIGVTYRSDGSGTTFVFTSYLSLVSPAWASGPGNGTSVSWPTGTGKPGNAGVASYVNTTTYALGYVELAYSLTNGLTYAKLKNPQNQYILPSLIATQNAVNAASGSLPSGNSSWYHVSLLNENAANAYPIASFSYFLLYKDLGVIPGITPDRANLVVAYIWYHIHEGQAFAPALGYVQLPSSVVTIDETTLNSVTFNGHTVSHTPGVLPTPTLSGALPIALLALSSGIAFIAVRRRK